MCGGGGRLRLIKVFLFVFELVFSFKGGVCTIKLVHVVPECGARFVDRAGPDERRAETTWGVEDRVAQWCGWER